MDSKHEMPKGIIQIYPAYEFHDDVVIIANKKALENLRQAIDHAIESGKSEAIVWAKDGEGYGILIKKVADGWDNKVWDKLPPHYTADWITKDGKLNPAEFYLSEANE